MLDTTTTAPDSEELRTLTSRLKYVDIYLDQALPRACAEEARNNLELNVYISECGTKGCVLFHCFDELNDQVSKLKGDVDKACLQIAGINAIEMCGHPTFLWAQPFGGKATSLGVRRIAMQNHRAELVSKIESLVAA